MLATSLATGQASAIDPQRAERDAAEIVAKHDAFCRSPARPLSKRGLATCPIVDQLPSCEGLRAACEAERLQRAGNDDEASSRWLSDELRAVLVALGRTLVWLLLAALLVALAFPLIAALVRRRRERALAEGPARSEVPVARAAPEEDALLAEDDPEMPPRRAADLAPRPARGGLSSRT